MVVGANPHSELFVWVISSDPKFPITPDRPLRKRTDLRIHHQVISTIFVDEYHIGLVTYIVTSSSVAQVMTPAFRYLSLNSFTRVYCLLLIPYPADHRIV